MKSLLLHRNKTNQSITENNLLDLYAFMYFRILFYILKLCLLFFFIRLHIMIPQYIFFSSSVARLLLIIIISIFFYSGFVRSKFIEDFSTELLVVKCHSS